MTPQTRSALRASLVAVWLITGLVSLWELNGASRQLLWDAGWRDTALIQTVVISGAALDLVLGGWMWRQDRPLVYRAALWATVAMTILGTVLLPALWLHPLGPLLKNMPIVAVLWALAQESPE